MMNSTHPIPCSIHPTQPALWSCHRCGADFCASCITRRERGGLVAGSYLYLCPRCHIEAQALGISNILVPFWRRMPRFFLYPFGWHPLILLFSLSLLAVLFREPGLVNGLMRFAIWGVMVKYAFEALKTTAGGDLCPPTLSIRTLSDDFHIVFKQIALYVVLGFAVAALGASGGPILMVLPTAFALLLLPAMIIVLATTDSLIAALNPLVFTRLAWRIGWGYLLMYVFLILLMGAPTYFWQYVVVHMPEAIQGYLIIAAQGYYTIIGYHLMGYVILQYHEEVGYEVDYESFQDPTFKVPEIVKNPDHTMLKESGMLVQAGKLDEAIDQIRQHAQVNGIKDLALSERYFKLLKMKKHQPEFWIHGETHLELLTQANRKADACKLYLFGLNAQKQLAQSSETLFKLGGWLNEKGKTRESLRTYGLLSKQFPADPLTPKAFFRIAQIVNDRLMNPTKARAILNTLIKKYPEHEIIPMARSYLDRL